MYSEVASFYLKASIKLDLSICLFMKAITSCLVTIPSLSLSNSLNEAMISFLGVILLPDYFSSSYLLIISFLKSYLLTNPLSSGSSFRHALSMPSISSLLDTSTNIFLLYLEETDSFPWLMRLIEYLPFSSSFSSF